MIFPDFQTNAMLGLKSKISRLANSGEPQEDFLFSNLNEWQASDTRKFMLTAQDYYGNDNDIKDRKRYYIDRKGIRQEAPNLANSKLNHPFMRKLTNQKVNYLLSKEFSIQCDDDKFSEVTGYTNPLESKHDFFKVGHTSTSVSLCLGLAVARDLRHTKENIIAVIGDGSLSGGEALEALDYAGEYKNNLIIIVNDNDQSIAENHGGLYKNLKKLPNTKFR